MGETYHYEPPIYRDTRIADNVTPKVRNYDRVGVWVIVAIFATGLGSALGFMFGQASAEPVKADVYIVTPSTTVPVIAEVGE